MDKDLIYDFGMHVGEDTDFYLKKGFRVVAVEGLPALCEVAEKRFLAAVRSGQLTIVNSAVVAQAGPVSFFVNPHSVWGTVNREWADRNARLGSASTTEITVPGVLASDLLDEHGTPYYMKIDIEGSDRLCLEALRNRKDRPEHVSIESDKVSWAGLLAEFDLFQEFGYRRFKVVWQSAVPKQALPSPALEGRDVQHSFPVGSSGAFGEEAPGPWMTRDQALARYRQIFLQYRLFGDDIASRRSASALLGRAVRHIFGIPGWYDTHASF